MKLEQRLAAAEAELAAIKAEMVKKDEWPKVGDKVYHLQGNGKIYEHKWEGVDFDKDSKEVGSLFRTRKEAEAELEARKVIAELRQCDGYRPFVIGDENYSIDVDLSGLGYVNINNWAARSYGWQSIYFESRDAVESAIEKVGRDHIIKASRWLAMREV